ncbi:MAG: antitoxin family protein [Gemmataceae bacterium]
MTLTIEAIYENGVLTPKHPLALAEGTEVRVTISTLQKDADPLDEVIGICTEGPDISLAARHDELLYGLRPPAKEQP